MNELIREHAIHSAKKILLVSALTAIIGCAHVISREVREEADRDMRGILIQPFIPWGEK